MMISTDVEFIYIVLDVEEEFLSSLPQEAADRLCHRTDDLADATRDLAPTLRVVCGLRQSGGRRYDIFAGSSQTRTDTENRQLQHELNLSRSALRPDQDVMGKAFNSLFAHAEAAAYIRARYTNAHTLAFAGMNTSFCVAQSIIGGIQSGFKCIALSDMLADTSQPRLDPAGHEKLLRDGVTDHYSRMLSLQGKDPLPFRIDALTDNLATMTTDEFCRRLKEKPAPPAKATPVSQFLKATA